MAHKKSHEIPVLNDKEFYYSYLLKYHTEEEEHNYLEQCLQNINT